MPARLVAALAFGPATVPVSCAATSLAGSMELVKPLIFMEKSLLRLSDEAPHVGQFFWCSPFQGFIETKRRMEY